MFGLLDMGQEISETRSDPTPSTAEETGTL
jgi:hypothetical protein